MFRSTSHFVACVVRAGRIGRKRSFVTALVAAQMLMPAAIATAVLHALWERIEIRNRQVVRLTARADRALRAHQLIATALQYIKDGQFDESDIEDQPRPPQDGGPGAARNTSMSGKGGIQTRHQRKVLYVASL